MARHPPPPGRPGRAAPARWPARRSRSTTASTSRPPTRWWPGFEKATGIKVKVRNDDEDVFDNEIQTEGSHSPADVIYTENTPALEFLQEHDLLAPVDPSTLAHTPTRFNSPQGDWVGVSARVSVLDYNPSKISASDLPKTALAMADPKYKGLLAIAPGETDFQPIVTSMIKQYGTARTLQWLEGLKANAGSSHSYPDNETIASDVNSGKVAFGLINQYYWYRLGAQIGASNYHSKLAYFAPHDPGYVLNVSGAGVLASSKHQAAAQEFLAYLTSKAGPGDHRAQRQLRIPDRVRRHDHLRAGDAVRASCSRTRSTSPSSVTGRPRSPC